MTIAFVVGTEVLGVKPTLFRCDGRRAYRFLKPLGLALGSTASLAPLTFVFPRRPNHRIDVLIGNQGRDPLVIVWCLGHTTKYLA